MIDIPVISKIFGEALKIRQHFKDKHEEKEMRAVADELRRSTYANRGNLLRAEIGSEKDRLYQKMVAKGFLIKVPLGYMLPEFFHGGRYGRSFS